MRIRTVLIVVLFLAVSLSSSLACSVCFGAPQSKTSQNMGVAIWFLMGAVMAVLGGVGAFSFHLWRHASTPLAPEQELTQEDLEKYE